jgi:hypothetical protein
LRKMKVRDVIKMLVQDGWYLDVRGGATASTSTRLSRETQMREAIAFHLDSMARDGEPIPEPHTYSAYVEVPAQAR